MAYTLDSMSEGFSSDDGYAVSNKTPVTEIRASLGELIPGLPDDTMSIDEFKSFLKKINLTHDTIPTMQRFLDHYTEYERGVQILGQTHLF